MFTFRVRSFHWFVPFLIGLLAGYFQHNDAPPGVYWIGYISALGCVVWFFFNTWWMERANNDAWRAHLIETYLRLTPEERVELGYKKASARVALVQSIPDPSGFVVTSKYDWIPWGEGAFQSYCSAILRGSSLAFREWEGSGRLFKDGQYEAGVKKLIALGYQKKNGDAVNSPLVMTDNGLRAFAEYMSELGIPYEILPEYEERLK